MKFLIFLVLFCLNCMVQLHAVYFNKLTSEDGLVHPSVLSIAQDSLGRIWFGTENGLSIYDGKRIVSYRPYQQIPGKILFRGNDVYNITCSFDGDVFIQTSLELLRYEMTTGKFSLVYNQKVSAMYAKNGEVWFVIHDKLYKWNSYSKKLVFNMNIPLKNISRILFADDGKKWFVSEEGLSYTEDDIHFIKKSSISFYSIFESTIGDIWLGCKDKGLWRIDKEGLISNYDMHNANNKGLMSNNVRQISEDANGNIWFGTFNGLYMYDLSTDSFISYVRAPEGGGLSQSSVYSVFIDPNNILWIGTYFGGVNYANLGEDRFVYYSTSGAKTTLSHPVVGEMLEDNRGNIWICTEGGGINLLYPKEKKIHQFKTKNFPYFSPQTNIKSIAYDDSCEILYIGTTFNGLYSYDIKKNIFNKESNKMNNEITLNSINVVRKDGDSLILSTNESVYIYSLRHKSYHPFFYQQGDRYAYVSPVIEKEFWIVDNHIHKINMENLKETNLYILSDSLHRIQPKRILQTKDKNIYVGTYGNGIMKLDKSQNKFVNFPSSHSSLLSSFCFQLAETINGNLVTIGDKGVAIFSKEGKILQLMNAGKNIPLTSFTRDCGLLVASDGTIYVGGTNGLISFKERKQNNKFTNELYFSDLWLDGRLIYPNEENSILSSTLPFTKTVSLPYSHSRIEVSFASKNNITQFNQSIYEYRLLGIDNIWHQTNENSIIYTNLPTGKYTLELRELNYNGKTSSTCKLKIQITPPWYFTWWAWLIWIVLALLPVYLIIQNIRNRARTRMLIETEKMEKEKIREVDEAKFKFFTSVSHEFRTPLTLIIGLIEQIVHSYKLPTVVQNKMIKVMRQSEHLSRLVTELIEFRKYEQNIVRLNVSPLLMNQFVENICDGFHSVAMKKNITFTFEKDPTNVKVYVDIYQMEKVVYNLLANAFKYTNVGGKVKVTLQSDPLIGFFKLQVSDTGIGIPEDDLPHIFNRFYQVKDNNIRSTRGSGIGLALVKDIVEKHKGTVCVQSSLGKGTTFIVTLLLGYSHLENCEYIMLTENNDISSSLTTWSDPNMIEEEDTENDILPTDTFEGKKPHILFVEDNSELRIILKEYFERFYEVDVAPNGIIGMEKVKDIHPDLVVSDVMMPGMSGTELCSQIKNDIELCHIPVVLLTALNMPEQNLEGLLLGADDYIGKPFNIQILLARCNNIIRSRRLLHQKFSKQADADMTLLATNHLDRNFLNKVSETIEHNIANSDFNIDTLAAELCMSRASFYNKFKDLTHSTPNDFINTYRLKKAASLLIQNDYMTVSEISDAMGFSSPNYFCRKFKEYFSVTPTQFKANHGQKPITPNFNI